MSFSTDVKNELAHVEPEKKCCKLAEIAGFIRMCGSMSLGGKNGMKIILPTDNPAIARHYKLLIKDYFDVDADLEVGEQSNPLKKGKEYKLILDDRAGQKAEIILRETGILMIRQGMNYISDGIYDMLIKSKCCRKAYLRGAFLGGGTMADPEKSYQLEFVCNTKNLANDMKKLFAGFTDLSPRSIARGKRYVVYFKDGNQIGDILNIMKAHNQYFAYENVRMKKEFRNNANRASNCDSANSDKQVNTAVRQVAAIRKIEEKRGLAFMDPKLREAAMLRLEHPDVSLAELGEIAGLTKAGINNRLKRIEEIAAKI